MVLNVENWSQNLYPEVAHYKKGINSFLGCPQAPLQISSRSLQSFLSYVGNGYIYIYLCILGAKTEILQLGGMRKQGLRYYPKQANLHS